MIKTQRDTCDTLLVNDSAGRELSDRQQRFLDAYRARPNIASAALLARVHRASVYRWQADLVFAGAMRAAFDSFHREHQAKVIAQEEARQERRRQRELERRPMRCLNLALAREEKRRR